MHNEWRQTPNGYERGKTSPLCDPPGDVNPPKHPSRFAWALSPYDGGESASAARPDSRLQRHPCRDSCPRIALIFHAHSSNWLPVIAALVCVAGAQICNRKTRSHVLPPCRFAGGSDPRIGGEAASKASTFCRAHSNSRSQSRSSTATHPQDSRQKATDRIITLRVTRTRSTGKEITISWREVSVILK